MVSFFVVAGAGSISEWRATLIARETGCLSLEHRMTVDATLAGDPAALEAMGDGELVAQARKLAYRLDRRHSSLAAGRQSPTGTSRCGRCPTSWPACPPCCPSPTGHRYWSIAPAHRATPAAELSPAEFAFHQQLVLAA